jgi:hypothetical protein
MMSTERAYPLRVRLEVTAQRGAVLFTPISGHHQPGPVGPKGANSGIIHRSKQKLYMPNAHKLALW